MNIIDFIREDATLEDFVEVFLNYLEDRGQDSANESVYDLECEDDYNYFSALYGQFTAERCKKISKYWVGGLNYYANEDDRTGTRCAKIFNINENNYKVLCNEICCCLEDLIKDLTEEYGTKKFFEEIKNLSSYYNYFFNLTAFAKVKYF